MEFGLFYEICVPRPWDPGKEARIIRQVIEQVRYAEEMGFRYVWLTEHHFLQEFSHCSAPEVLLGALSQVTTEIRLGHGVVLTPPRYNHPARVAERCAMIDCLSNGRLEIGTGRSITPTELDGFEIDASQSREMWLEGAAALARLLSEESVALDGRYVRMPERTVVPRCVQQPHPPLWMAGTSPSTVERAASVGLGVLFFAHGMLPEQLAGNVAVYRKRIESAKPLGKRINERLAGFVNGLCGDDDAETKAIGGQAALDYMLQGMAYSRWPRDVEPPAGYEYTRQAMWDGEVGLRALGADGMIEQGLIMAGNPSSCNDLVKRYHEVGVDQLIIHMQASGIPHERIMESIRMFGTHVIPEYARATRE
jgi:alkanesulfonate monooxygenase SsuD/methylene tetrahydromethanopterin reductase-like flavin-dependent oxidoreductase (luciferase family)